MNDIRQKIDTLRQEISIFHYNVIRGEVGDFEHINQKFIFLFQEIEEHQCYQEFSQEISELDSALRIVMEASMQAREKVKGELKTLNQYKQANIRYYTSLKNSNNT